MPEARLLIAVGQAAADPEQIPFGVRGLIRAADQILVIAPALPGRLEWIASATDQAREQADRRLQAVLGQLDEIDAPPAEGTIGADDPLLAFEDAVAEFDPGHILIALRADEWAGWQERGLLDQIGRRFGLPITVFQLPA